MSGRVSIRWSRRRMLAAGASAAGLAALGAGRGAVAGQRGRGGAGATQLIAFANVHTGERLEVEWSRGDVALRDSVAGALARIQVFLRDWRTDEQHAIDPQLMDSLVAVAACAGVDPVFEVISGYRSPHTNETLRERSAGVARRSLHLEGRAIDVRLARVDCATLAGHALDLARGGVGYYRRSDFVHLDTGAVRTWKG